MAVALEQENKAKAQDARAKVILAEAEVPLAMAEAFRNGNLGIMDYYKMKNIMADTSMRETIARPEKKITSSGGFPGVRSKPYPFFFYIRCRIELYHCNIRNRKPVPRGVD